MARPTKFTSEVRDIILKAIGLGASLKDSAAAANVDYNTLNEWRKKGAEAKGGQFREFYEALEREEAEGALRHLSNINNAAAKGDWKASLEWLKRRRRSEWGDAVDITSDHERINLSDDQYARAIIALIETVREGLLGAGTDKGDKLDAAK